MEKITTSGRKRCQTHSKPKGKIGFINGTISKPSIDDLDFENWHTVNSMIVGWIRASIEPKVKSTLTFIDESYQLRSELKPPRSSFLSLDLGAPHGTQ